MRSLTIAILCLIALPASAQQRVNTRVIDIKQHADGRNDCRFQAMPDIKMTEPHRGSGDGFAQWSQKARDGDAWLHARFSPQEREGRIQTIEVSTSSAIAEAASAQVFIDNDPSPVAFDLRRGGWDRWVLTPTDGAALANAMRYTDLLSVRLLNAKGKRLGSYEFWIGDFKDIAEYPRIVEWQCRAF